MEKIDTETKIYLIRHAQTEWNRAGIAQGQMDSPLTPEGIDKTKMLSPGIKEIDPDVVFSSDLGRAVNTAEFLTCDIDKEIFYEKGLREMDFGVFSGKSWNYIENEMSDLHKLFASGDPDFIIPGGESHNQFFQRVISCLKDIAEKNIGKKILIVTHGGSLNNILSFVSGISSSEKKFFGTVNLGINILNYMDDEFSLDSLAVMDEYSWTK